jgi:Flp pilus assembly protein TadG
MKRSRGQGLVEFALVLPVFLLLLFGALDGARLVYTYNTLSQAAREGARVAAVETSTIGGAGTDPSCVASESAITTARPGAHVCPANTAALKSDVVSAVNRMTVGLGQITALNVYLACTGGAASGEPAPSGAWDETTVTYPQCADSSTGTSAPTAAQSLVSVRVIYSFRPITPVISALLGTIGLSGAATMVIH